MEKDDYKKRSDRIRKNAIDIVYRAKAPHIGSALSCADILTAVYALADLEKIKCGHIDRDRIILSKGHAIAAQLSALCEFGLLSKESILEFCKPGCCFPENTAPYTPFIDIPTGSLGQGASFAVGAAYGMRLKDYKSRVYTILGDGELNEGQCWEAFQQAAFHGLDNIIVLIDANRLSGIGETCGSDMLYEKMSAFGFYCEVLDGHNVDAIMDAVNKSSVYKKPKAFVCSTIKGYGVSFMQGNNDWHYRPVSDHDYADALKELLVEDKE